MQLHFLNKSSFISGLRKHDVAFLITVRPRRPIGMPYNPSEPFVPQVGLCYVRGCEVEGMLDENGRVIEEGKIIKNLNRTLGMSLRDSGTVSRNILYLDLYLSPPIALATTFYFIFKITVKFFGGNTHM